VYVRKGKKEELVSWWHGWECPWNLGNSVSREGCSEKGSVEWLCMFIVTIEIGEYFLW